MNRAFQKLPIGLCHFDLDLRYVYINDWLAKLNGISAKNHIGHKIGDVLPELSEHVIQNLLQVIDSGEPLMDGEVVAETPAQPGILRTFKHAYIPVKSDDGTVMGLSCVVEEVTDLKKAEDALRQAQRMESLGQLTGGVAHDFNNLLFVIGGNLDLLSSELGDDDEAHLYIDSMVEACARGANLTQHLLAFSRKQTLKPETVHIGGILKTVTGLLTRTIGENIEIKLTLAPDTGVARVDPGQLENALLNLAVNARDAMAEGGELTIEARIDALDAATAAHLDGARPERYVHIGVKDTGTGMPPEAARRAFEPFFTTKEVGKGTGLGLSMVYGFVQQSGGFVTLDSVEGRGTTVDLYLPMTEEKKKAGRDGTTEIVGGSEAILLVEDDSGVRAVATGMLVKLGYRVVEAADAPQALILADKGIPFDLLITDVVLPGSLSGPNLAKTLRKQRPALKVLFMSGYSRDEVKAVGDLLSQAKLLTKPFRYDELARAVREALA